MVQIFTPDRNGRLDDVVLGYDTLAEDRAGLRPSTSARRDAPCSIEAPFAWKRSIFPTRFTTPTFPLQSRTPASVTVRRRYSSSGKQGGDEDIGDLDRLQPNEREYGLSSAMIRGVAAGFREIGGVVGGFDAYTVSDVLKGSGLSSSAAFVVCVATILNGEYNGSGYGAVTLGIIGQYAENVFFGKPSGLMDQITCSSGGVLSIDLKDPSAPFVEKVPLQLPGLRLVVTDTGGDHSNLTDEYAAIRKEMESVAGYFGKRCLREVCYDDFIGGSRRLSGPLEGARRVAASGRRVRRNHSDLCAGRSAG